jgi:hypothetical protein
VSDGGLLLLARWPAGEPAPEPPPASWWRLYLPLAGRGEGAMLAVPARASFAFDGRSRLQASLYRFLVGARPGLDYLNGDGPVSIFGVDVDPAVEEAWNHWYDTRHLPAVLSHPGTVAGARYKLEERLREGLGVDPRYLVVYEMGDAAAAERASDPVLMSPNQRATFDDWMVHGQPPTSNSLARKLRPQAPPNTGTERPPSAAAPRV